MQTDELCAACNRPVYLTGSAARVTNKTFCSDCVIDLSAVAKRVGLDGSQGLITLMAATSTSPPPNAQPGALWYSPQREQLYIAQGPAAGPEAGFQQTWLQAGRVRMPEPPVEPLAMWVIYRNPADFAGRSNRKGDVFVLRRWLVGKDSIPDERVTCYGYDLDEVRSHVPEGLVRMDAGPGDDPAILETWF